MFYLTLAFLHASYKKTTQWLFKAIPNMSPLIWSVTLMTCVIIQNAKTTLSFN